MTVLETAPATIQVARIANSPAAAEQILPFAMLDSAGAYCEQHQSIKRQHRASCVRQGSIKRQHRANEKQHAGASPSISMSRFTES